MEEVHVVTSFLEYQGKILLLCRSGQVGSYQQRWAGVSGYIEKGCTPLQQAYQEIAEEVGLNRSELTLIKEGDLLPVVDEKLGKKWVVHPFHFLLSTSEIKIDWEHSQFKWIKPEEIKEHHTVPGLYQAWEQVQ